MTTAQTHRFSLEFFPPKTKKGGTRLLKTVGRLQSMRPDFVSVTFGAGGSTRDRSYETTTQILKSTDLKVTPHLSCINATKQQIHDMLQLYETVGVRRIVALRGDLPEGESGLPQHFRYANELVEYIREHFDTFHISVACYPEFHPEAATPQSDVENFVRKVRAGADEAITQYFYSNDAYYRFVDEVRGHGVDIPIVPGLMPMTDFKQVSRFSKFCGADIPQWLRKRMMQYEDDAKAQQELGIEIASRQAEELLRNGAPGVHFYTLNRAEPTLRIWDNLGFTQGEPRQPVARGIL